MKKIFFISIVSLLSLVSCKKEPLSYFQYFEEAYKVEEITKYQLLERMGMDPNSALAAVLPNRKVKVVAIKYSTFDPQGNMVEGSGAMFYPVTQGTFEDKGAILAVHYTLAADYQVPSQRMACHEALFALLGYTVVAPDYLGYGTTKNMVHPYHHYQSTGEVSLDMLFAAKEYFASFNRRFPKNLTILGYSEGGYSSLACLKYIQENYPDWLRLREVIAGAGAYDLIASYNKFIATNYSSQPVTIPMLMIGLNFADNLNMDFQKLFLGEFRDKYQEWILSKKYTTDEITTFMKTTKVSEFIDMTLLAQQTNFIKALNDNSLVNWKPCTKVTLFHSKDDTIVPYENTESAYNAFTAQGCDVTLRAISGKDHKEAGNDFYMMCLLKLLVPGSGTKTIDIETQQMIDFLQSTDEVFFKM